MNIGLIVQYATLLWIMISGTSVAVAFFIHREQVKTQIFLALSARYDDLLESSSADFWLGMPPSTALPERSEHLTMSALRFCTLVSLTYFLFLERRIPSHMWHLMLCSAERRIRNPIFVREWAHLRAEFGSFPEFVQLVASLQEGGRMSERKSLSVLPHRTHRRSRRTQ